MKEDKNRLTTQVEKQIEKIEKLKVEIEEKDALIVNTGKTHEEKFALKQIQKKVFEMSHKYGELVNQNATEVSDLKKQLTAKAKQITELNYDQKSKEKTFKSQSEKCVEMERHINELIQQLEALQIDSAH